MPDVVRLTVTDFLRIHGDVYRAWYSGSVVTPHHKGIFSCLRVCEDLGKELFVARVHLSGVDGLVENCGECLSGFVGRFWVIDGSATSVVGVVDHSEVMLRVGLVCSVVYPVVPACKQNHIPDEVVQRNVEFIECSLSGQAFFVKFSHLSSTTAGELIERL